MINIIKRDVLLLLRDKGSLLMITLFPALLVLLLGSFLENFSNIGDNVIDPIVMNITIETTDLSGTASIHALIEALEKNDAIVVEQTTDYETARRRVDKSEATAAVLFTEPFGVEIYQGHDQIQNRAIDSIFRGFVQQTASIQVLSEEAPQQLSQAIDIASEELVKQKEFGYNRSMLDYYAVTMLVMILFMGGSIGGASNLYDSRRDGTIRRLLASSKSRVNIYISTVLGAVPQTIIQVACVMITSATLFNAHYADTIQANILLGFTVFIVGIAINAIFMIVGLFVRMNPTLVIMPLLWVMMFISGTFSKETYAEGISELFPAWQIQNAIFDLTVFGRSEKCFFVLIISAVCLVLSTIIGALLFNRKGVVIK